MDLNVNEGTRPSKLELGRYAAGELSAEERADLEARLDDEARAWLDEVSAAADSLPAFDPTALRARTATESAPAQPAPANNRAFFGVFLLLAAAVVGMVLLGMPGITPESDIPTIRARGTESGLEVHLFDGGALRPWEGEAVGEGDQLGFKVQGTGHEGVVLLSIDGSGQVNVFWPESGNRPEPLSGDGLVPLPGSLTLDGAPGPEVFLAVYDQTAAEAAAYAARTWQSGGPEALVEWAEQAEHVEAVVLERR